MSTDIALQAIDLVKHFATGSTGILGRATNIVQAVDGVSFSLPKEERGRKRHAAL